MTEPEDEVMTETEWLACEDPLTMLKRLLGRFGARKYRLFAVECCRGVWHLLKFEVSRQAVDVAERFAEGLATLDVLNQARRAANIFKTRARPN